MLRKHNIIQLENYHSEESTCQACMRRHLCLAKTLSSNDLLEFDRLVAHPEPVKRRQTICRAGDNFDRLFFVRSGTFKSYRVNENGNLHVTGFYFPGDLMGLDDLNSRIHSDYIESLETSSICELSFSALEEMFAIQPALITWLLDKVSAEINREKDMMYLLGKLDVNQKLASFLLNFAARSYRSGFSKTTLHLCMTRNDIANYLGMAGETISRALHRLHDTNVINVRNRNIEIIDFEALEALVQEGEDSLIVTQGIDINTVDKIA
jgi:CRP/FNR family transcriptional regulator